MTFTDATPNTKVSTMVASGFSPRADGTGAANFTALVSSLICKKFQKDLTKKADGKELSLAVKLLMDGNYVTDQVSFSTFVTKDLWTIPASSANSTTAETAALTHLSRPTILNFLVYLSKIVGAADNLNYEVSDSASLTSLTAWLDAVEHLRRHDAASSVSTGSLGFGSGSDL